MSIIFVNDGFSRRLILAKDALGEARNLIVNSNLELNLMRSVWLADFAMELFILAICQHPALNAIPKIKRIGHNPSLPDYFEELRTKFHTDAAFLLLLNKAAYVHTARNNIQHQGVAYVKADAFRFVEDSYEFINFLTQKYLNSSIDSINISILNSDSEAQTYFDLAVGFIDQENYAEAAKSISIGFKIAYDNLMYLNNDVKDRDWNEIKKRWGMSLEGKIAEIIRSHRSDSRLGYVSENLVEAIELIAKMMSLTQFDIEINTSIAFFDLLPEYMRSAGSMNWFPVGKDRTYNRQELDFMFDTAIKIIYRVRMFIDKNG